MSGWDDAGTQTLLAAKQATSILFADVRFSSSLSEGKR